MKKTTTFLAGLLLAGAVHAQTVANSGMETWRNFTVAGNAYELPTDWYSLDSTLAILGPQLFMTSGKKHIFKTTDVHGGSGAALVRTRNYGALGNLPGGLANAEITVSVLTQSYALKGGTAVSQRMGTASAWVKYVPKGTGDSASLLVQAVLAGRGANGTDSIVGSGITKIPAMAAYTQVSAGITYINNTVVPDHIQVALLSSNLLTGTAVDSSALYVDDVTIANNVGVSRTIFKAATVQVYPNPAAGTLFLATREAGRLKWEAIAPNGQVVAEKEFTQSAAVSLAALPAGSYFYRVLNAGREVIQTGKLTVQ